MAVVDKSNSVPLFTVIIPVKNRAKYLYHTLRTCMMQNYDQLEIIVSDDGSTDNTREVVEDAMRIDSRIRYYSHGTGIGMRDNFEFALQQVKPGYVIALGGDDGLLPDGIKGMWKVLQNTGLELLAWPAPLFIFPDVHDTNGQLSIYHQKGTKIIDSHQFLSNQAKNLHYLSDIESPMFYVKGVASTKLIDKVKSRSADGLFYTCPTPDGYSGIVLAGEVSQYAFSAEPFSIYGMSSSSQGLAYLSNEEQAKKDSESFFKDTFLKPMHSELASQPYSPLITLMTVDYLLTARDLPDWTGSFPSINYKQVLCNGLNELAHGLYGESRIARELQIMKKIAELHGLEEFYLDKVRKSKRYRKKSLFNGSGINPKLFFLDAKVYNLHNIYDAAYAAKYIYNTYSNLTPKYLTKSIYRSFRYRFLSMRKGDHFPPESEWNKNK